MKRNNCIFKILLCFVLMFAGILITKQDANAQVKTVTYQSGNQNPITYTYDTQTGVLSFSGKGLLYAANDENWFELDPTKIIIGEGFDSIQRYCFNYTVHLKEVVLPESMRKIGNGAFSDCENLETVHFPKKLTRIGSYAFSLTTALSEVRLPQTVKKIGRNAFRNSGIESIEVPKGTIVNDYAFSYCQQLKKVIYRGENIPEGLFSNCESLKKLSILSNIDSVGSKAFEKCGFSKLTLPASVKTIDSGAFRDCKKLTSFVIPKKVTSIEKGTFRNCKKLSEITIGKNVEIIKEKAFVKCNLGELVIPGNVATLDYGAFRKAGITSVEIEDGVETIGDWAFSGNRNLDTVTIPESVSVIQENALTQCDSLTDIFVDEENAFFTTYDGMLLSKDGTKLITCPAGKKGTVTIPSSILTLTEYSFDSCDKVTAYALNGESELYSVKDGVLYDSTGTILVRYPQGIKGWVEIPVGVVQIGAYSFSGSLADEIFIPYTTTKIGVCAFEHCNNITTITIPGNVKTIAAAAFWSCKNLEKVTLESGCEHIRRLAFSNCKKLTAIRIPTSVSSIALTAFSDVYELTIYCPKQSMALAFAKKNWYSYKLI